MARPRRTSRRVFPLTARRIFSPVFGINPGVGYPGLQARKEGTRQDGIWAERVRRQGLSHCFERSPEEDPENWRRFHGGRSRYWERVMPFAGRWVAGATIGDVLAMELYPWHSERLDGGINTPANLAQRFVFEPIAGLEVRYVFSFSKPWLGVAQRLRLKQLRYEVLSHNSVGSVLSTVSVFELVGGQQLVASTNANGFPLAGHDFDCLQEMSQEPCLGVKTKVRLSPCRSRRPLIASSRLQPSS